jgi:predicted RecB family nuclease
VSLSRLQVHSGTGEIIDLPYVDKEEILNVLSEIADLYAGDITVQYVPVGWSKCSGCGYFGLCWKEAEAAHGVALIAGVDQNLASALHEAGVRTVEHLLKKFSEAQLAEFRRPRSTKQQRVGKKAGLILIMAKALAEGREIIIRPPSLPVSRNYVVFDIEGLSPHLDEIGKIYLWGMQVFGDAPSEYMPSLTGFGENGNRGGWHHFLDNAKAIFRKDGDVPFIHWHQYERIHLDKYLDEFGDREGIATRIGDNLFDLLDETQESLALPIPSYSLKVVERHIGYRRSQDEYGGEWSMAKYIEATELENTADRDNVINQILTYNREDLEAAWSVFQWVLSHAR